MGFLDKLGEAALSQAEKAQKSYDKGYGNAENLSDEQIKKRMKDSHRSTMEKAGMAKVYRERNGLD